MLFMEALSLLESGGSVRRESWKESDGYLVLLDGMEYVWKIILHPNPNAGNYIFSVKDLKGDDWIKFESPKDSIEVVPEVLAEC